jgi:hypothetical protein
MQPQILGEAPPQKALSSQVRRCKPLLWLFFNGCSENRPRQLLERNSFSFAIADRESVRNDCTHKKINSLIQLLQKQYCTKAGAWTFLIE